MALASISLRGFRNLEPTSVDFAEGSNYLFGPNGAGKTNLLEAIHYLAIGRSFRRCPDAELLGFGKDVLAVSGTDESGDTAEVRFDGREKRILRNNIPVEKLSEYFGWLPVVVLLLEDIELVKGVPGIRRSFLDMAISKAEGGTKSEAKSQKPKVKTEDGAKLEARGERRGEEQSYITLTAEYRRAVSQYNRLLERSGASREPVADQLSAWEEELVMSGVPVYEARLAKVGELLENAARHYERLAGHGAVFSYRSSIVHELAKAFRTETGEPLVKAIELALRKWTNLGLVSALLQELLGDCFLRFEQQGYAMPKARPLAHKGRRARRPGRVSHLSYEEALRKNRIPLSRANTVAEQSARQKAGAARASIIADGLRSVLAAKGIPADKFVAYFAFAQKLGRLSRTYTDKSLQMAAADLIDLYEAKALDGDTLRAIAAAVFGVSVTS